MPAQAFINRIAAAVPENGVHRFFLQFAGSQLTADPRRRAIFDRMADRCGIEHRYSCFAPADDPEGPSVDLEGVFKRGAFPGTAKRMEMFAATAPALAEQAVEKLLHGQDRSRITHLIVTTCTGFSAPGLDLEIIARCNLPTSIERTILGFMGCYAAINALKQARHIIRSEPEARVLVVSIELCTLHLKETSDLEKLLSFCLWGDGCSAASVSASPFGIGLDSFHALVDGGSRDLMTWNIRDDGFDMVLSGEVPAAIHHALGTDIGSILGNRSVSDVDLWAVHPGGRSVLDAVERALNLRSDALSTSREVLRENGNMSSATVMFVLERMLREATKEDRVGCAMAFGPGLTTETMMFHTAGDT
ncbi:MULTISPECIES: type III polyketide synthase [unclassified Mesorhizobium]|uniref:type III polyketide synthase n=1 Tax=unclassified Mesorhizobium TaxID=325217 RepID=UPI00112BB6E3|nr:MULTISPECIES: type III polyketide synthase [unclassified Mesorhizobium]TPL35396.1 type III polyketide synthase [Mesorhizobium sp. B2-4-8]TPL63290.1 type III polyketide synthase [Mesorhizobium sp. B2-4-1]